MLFDLNDHRSPSLRSDEVVVRNVAKEVLSDQEEIQTQDGGVSLLVEHLHWESKVC